jgi:hypothetical protein
MTKNTPPTKPAPAAASFPAPLRWAVEFLPDYFTDPPCAFHVELMRVLADPARRLIARVAPRGHAKSTCAALAYPLWCICERRRRNIVIITHEASLATQFVRDIRQELESNERISAAYGDLCTEQGIKGAGDRGVKGTGRGIKRARERGIKGARDQGSEGSRDQAAGR